MFYKVRYTAKAAKSLAGIPESLRRRVADAVDSLSINPFVGKKLKGKLMGYYSLRVWPYRIIYFVKKHEITVIILDIGHRQWIYK